MGHSDLLRKGNISSSRRAPKRKMKDIQSSWGEYFTISANETNLDSVVINCRVLPQLISESVNVNIVVVINMNKLLLGNY
jgi:hypothetical protein